MQDLKDVTNNVHYENYRSKKLAAVTCNGVDSTKNKGQLTKYDISKPWMENKIHVRLKNLKSVVVSWRFSLCDSYRSPLAQMEEERREHVTKMKKMETEMEQVFEMKVKEKKQKLKDSEAEVCMIDLFYHLFKLN